MARYGMLINTKKCVGCYACRVACQMVNGLESDEAFIKFDEMEQGVYPNVYAEVVPVQCHALPRTLPARRCVPPMPPIRPTRAWCW